MEAESFIVAIMRDMGGGGGGIYLNKGEQMLPPPPDNCKVQTIPIPYVTTLCH